MSPLEATIFNVQRFSIHDGPGIRTTVFFKGCPLRCRWCQNPESLGRQPEIAFYADRCEQRRTCLPGCPRGAITDLPERIDRELCDGCGECVTACAAGALQLVGYRVTVDDLVAELLRDQPFYRSSGGGATFSGGEATLQLDFVVELATAVRAAGVGVCLQTCGAFSWDKLAPHLGRFELIQFDLKLHDPAEHRLMTGGDNRVIHDNARRLVAAGAPVVFRTPLIPGVTDTEANLSGIAGFLAELEVTRIELLPYHRMGEIKNLRVGRPLPPLVIDQDPDSSVYITRAIDLLSARGLTVIAPETR